MNTSLVLTPIDGEPRIHDLLLAEHLGFERPTNIRNLIHRNLKNLKKLNKFNHISTVERCIEIGNGATRKVIEYYPDKKQAIFLCMKSETDNAFDVQADIVRVYDAYLSGVPVSPASAAALEARCTRLEALVAELMLAPKLAKPKKPLKALPRPDAAQRVLDYIRPLTEVVVADVQQDAAPDLSRVAIGKVIHRAGWTGKTCWRGTGAMRVWFAPMALH